MKKNKKEIKGSITIDKLDAMEHEKIELENIKLEKTKQKSPEQVYLLLAIIVKVGQYLSLLFTHGYARLFIFASLFFISWGLLVMTRVIRTKWDISKLVACFFIMLTVLDLAIVVYYYNLLLQ